MTDRTRWLAQWGYTDGTPEAEEAWAAKVAFVPIRLNPLIMRDIQPYQAMGTDVETGSCPMITSRSEHREYLRRNNYTEVGDQPIGTPREVHSSPTEIAHDVKRAIEQTGATL